MKQNKLKSLIELVGLNYKKEMIKLVTINVTIIICAVLALLFFRQTFVLVLIISFLVLANYFFLSSYSTRRKILEREHNEEFIALMSYFQTFVTNRNNVYQCFNKLLEFSSYWMKERIERFLTSVDTDKSVKPYVDFASHFSLGIAKNVMLSIYQMIDQGESSTQLMQFSYLFQNMSESHHAELKERKVKSLGSVTAFPLAGAGAIVIILSISIISVVGEMVNVI